MYAKNAPHTHTRYELTIMVEIIGCMDLNFMQLFTRSPHISWFSIVKRRIVLKNLTWAHGRNGFKFAFEWQRTFEGHVTSKHDIKFQDQGYGTCNMV
jgi:hypothetical protein